MVTVRFVGPDKGPWHKFERAGHHLEELKEAVGRFQRDHPDSERTERDRQTGELVYYAVIGEQPPPAFGLILGDLAHNLKAALDHAVWAMLAPDPFDTRTEYPIFEDRNLFRKQGFRKVERLPLRAKKIVIRAQPYRIAQAGGAASSDPLWLLYKLDGTDKHRELLTGTAVAAPYLMEINPKSPEHEDWQPGLQGRLALHDGDELLRIARNTEAKVEVKPRFIHFVVMSQGGPAEGHEIIRLATDMYNRVRFELYELDPFIR